jgi:demethylmenaquinone methyltransferase/2-methoxy-6-polyprenyl-1,4-benzoquinol methylase
MSFGTGQFYRRDALVRAGLRSGMAVLDVGTGTGLLAREAIGIVESRGRVFGVDPSSNMMQAGRAAFGMARVQGVGERLPFATGRFDFVTMGYALRHVPDLDQTFEEYYRVLKPGGRVLLLEISAPASRVGRGVAAAYFGRVVPLVARLGTGSADAQRMMKFYWDTIEHCVPPDTVLAALGGTGFAQPTRTVTQGIFSEYTATKK